MLSIESDGKVQVVDKGTNKIVRLWPIDAKEAIARGSHALPGAATPAAPAAPSKPAPAGDPRTARQLELAALNAAQVGALATKAGLKHVNKQTSIEALLDLEFATAPKGWASGPHLEAFLAKDETELLPTINAWVGGTNALEGQADPSPAGAQLAAETAVDAEIARGGAREAVVAALQEAAEVFRGRADL